MTRALVTVLVLALAGCATNPARDGEATAKLAGCRDGVPDDAEVTLRFAGRDYELAWQRRCDNGATRVFRAASGRDGVDERLVTLTRYPPDATVASTLDAYLARSAAERVGEPQVFDRGSGDGARSITELMLRREDAGQLEYVLHGVARGRGDRVISVTYTHRFAPEHDTGLAEIKAEQTQWVRAIERHLAAFPTP